MSEIKKKLEAAWDGLARIPVAGNAVELMARCRQALREAYFLAEDLEKKECEDHG